MLLQSTPEDLHGAVLSRCLRDVAALPGVRATEYARFWALQPGVLIGSLVVIAKREANEQHVLRHVRAVRASIFMCTTEAMPLTSILCRL